MRFQVKVDSFELFDEVMNYKTVPSEPITQSGFLYTNTQNRLQTIKLPLDEPGTIDLSYQTYFSKILSYDRYFKTITDNQFRMTNSAHLLQ